MWTQCNHKGPYKIERKGEKKLRFYIDDTKEGGRAHDTKNVVHL